mmetsp:Transcript_54005/g.157666  ORF Transcript_54005/g.157666 Transcript_54005/m.157666 type:complete len:486 (-) Transcript_54005:37-1494(-)
MYTRAEDFDSLEYYHDRSGIRFGELSKLLQVATVVATVMFLYVLYVYMHCLRLLQLDLPSPARKMDDVNRAYAQMTVFHLFTALLLYCLGRCILTHPGGIPDGGSWDLRTEAEDWEREEGGVSMIETKHSGERRHCKWCLKYKPDRCHHCRVCNMCVLRMDHHCPWLGNTVGWANHKFFILFLAYASGACALLGVSIVQLLAHAMLPALTTFLLIGAEGLTLLLSSILMPFSLFHFWLLARNMTTIEFCEMMREKDSAGKDEEASGSLYDLGFFENIRSVMGASPLLWWAPVGGPMGDGVRYPSRHSPSVPEMEPAPPGRRRRCQGCEAPAAGAEEEGREDDPEAAHPSGAGEEPEDQCLQEAESASAAEGSSDCSGSEDLESQSCSAGESAARDFLVWHTATEFTDDLRIGCEFLGDALGAAALRTARLCTARGRGPARAAAVPRRRPTAVRFVPLPEGAGSDSGYSSKGEGRAKGTGWDFLFD